MKRKPISAIAYVFLFFFIMIQLIPGVSAKERSVEVVCEDMTVGRVSLGFSEKKVLSLQTEGLVAESFQWQILINEEQSQWVNIYDKTEANCEVSLAMIKNILNGADGAYIRGTVQTEGISVYSDPVYVFMETETTDRFIQQPESMEDLIVEAGTSAASPLRLMKTKASARDAKDFVTITIKYLDEASLVPGASELPIYTAYTAKLERGKAFEQDVISPTFLGFAPYYDADGDGNIDDSASVLPLDFAEGELTEDITFSVYYKAIDVNYSIRYFFQNIHDDLYTENQNFFSIGQAKTGTIITDEMIQSKLNEKDPAGTSRVGFEKLYHYPERVAADGSTVFECYYDRNYYLIQFDMNGGFGVDPIYARYDTPFIVNAPVRHGYRFLGWDLINIDSDGDGIPDKGDGNIDTVYSAIPASNVSYVACWETVQTTYSIVYWVEIGDGEYGFVTRKEQNALSSSRVSGTDNLSSTGIDTKYYEFVKADMDVLVKGDGSTVVNVYYKHKDYTLRFYYARYSANNGYQVVGGTTYPFGAYHTSTTENTSIQTLLENVTAWGKVKALPQVNAAYKDRYTLGQVTYGSYTYHYLEFTESFGSDIGDLWPIGIFDPVEINETHAQCSYKYAYFSAWNGEYRVKYTQDHKSAYGGNETIKGCYMYLDENVIFDQRFTDGNLVSFLGFWDNGADINWSIPKLFRYNLMVESLENPGEYELFKKFNTFDDSTVDNQTATSIAGLTYTGRTSSAITSGTDNTVVDWDTMVKTDVFFYYKRNEYDLTFYNYSDEVSAETLKYGTPLSDKAFVPDYPSTLEENAYEFEGWYTTAACYEDSKFELSQETMPAYDLALYAKWTPKQHTVNFFTTYDEMVAYETGASSEYLYQYDNVLHGTIIAQEIPNPERTDVDSSMRLTFAGWFYMENGEKKAFTPLDMPVKRDMHVFADWSSHSPQPYRVSYVLKSDPTVKVADDTVGFAYGGTTRTFTAKAGDPLNQLYADYNSGYFPTINSHSITVQAEQDEQNPVKNVFTFEYVRANDIKYTVRYLDKETGLPLLQDKVAYTSDAVVTERFVAIENMAPSSYYERLVIAVEYDEETGTWIGSDSNEIIFYYTKNETTTYYAVHYMLQTLESAREGKPVNRLVYNTDGAGDFEMSNAYTEGAGNINANVKITPQNFTGYEVVGNKGQMVYRGAGSGGKDTFTTLSLDSNGQYTIKVTEMGTELFIYYIRDTHPYKVYYYEYNTTRALAAEKTGEAPYGDKVQEEAKTVSGYTCVSQEVQELQIRSDETQNVIIFYYSPTQYTVEYCVVTDDEGEGGSLSRTIEVITGNNAIEGSIPTASQYYVFEGWYLDEECETPVDDRALVYEETNKLVPVKEKMSDVESNIFYARFVRPTADFIIDNDDASDEEQVFIYEIRNVYTDEVIVLSITGNGDAVIKNLPWGEYTVTQQNPWSWRYEDKTSIEVRHDKEDGTEVVVRQSAATDQWLNDNSILHKNKRGAF